MIQSEDGKTRFDVTLSNGEGDKVETYTWAYDYDGAVKRMQDGFAEEPNLWNGWKFTVHPVKEDE